MKKQIEITDEMKEGIEAEQKIAEINKQKREATTVQQLDKLDEKGLGFFEGYLVALEHQDRFKQIQIAMALYYVSTKQLYREKGFTNFPDYCKAIGINRAVGYEWVKNVEEFGVKDFSNLLEKVGGGLRFFREVKALPEEIKDAVVKGEKIEVNGSEYDLSKGGKELREVVKALVHEVNKSKLEKKAYDTHKTWNEKLAKKEEQIKKLTEQIEDGGLPKEDAEAIRRIQMLKIGLRGSIRMIESADVKGLSEEVKEELLLLAQYAHDRGEMCLGRMLEWTKGDSYRPAREDAEESFKKAWPEDEE